jgi:hypothetical protein
MRPVKTWAEPVEANPNARTKAASKVVSLPILQFMSSAPPEVNEIAKHCVQRPSVPMGTEHYPS